MNEEYKVDRDVDTNISEKDKAIIKRWSLRLSHISLHARVAYFITNPQENNEVSIEDAKYFYATLNEFEFSHLERDNTLPIFDHYGGISPVYSYAAGYLTNSSKDQYLVEYETPYEGYLYEIFTQCNILTKNEGIGRSYGLGKMGVRGARMKANFGLKIDEDNKILKKGFEGIEILTTGSLFNDLLDTRIIKWRLVKLRCDCLDSSFH